MAVAHIQDLKGGRVGAGRHAVERVVACRDGTVLSDARGDVVMAHLPGRD